MRSFGLACVALLAMACSRPAPPTAPARRAVECPWSASEGPRGQVFTHCAGCRLEVTELSGPEQGCRLEVRTSQSGEAVASVPLPANWYGVARTLQVKVVEPGRAPDQGELSSEEDGESSAAPVAYLGGGCNIPAAIQVVDDLGKPVAGARVWEYPTDAAHPDDMRSGITGRDGRVTIAVCPGPTKVGARVNGWPDVLVNAAVGTRGAQRFTVTVAPPGSFELHLTCDGKPCPDDAVRLSRKENDEDVFSMPYVIPVGMELTPEMKQDERRLHHGTVEIPSLAAGAYLLSARRCEVVRGMPRRCWDAENVEVQIEPRKRRVLSLTLPLQRD